MLETEFPNLEPADKPTPCGAPNGEASEEESEEGISNKEGSSNPPVLEDEVLEGFGALKEKEEDTEGVDEEAGIAGEPEPPSPPSFFNAIFAAALTVSSLSCKQGSISFIFSWAGKEGKLVSCSMDIALT